MNPCTSPYVPWYLGITKIPAGYSWISPEMALASHFNVPQADLSYRPGRAWWAFQSVQDLADAAYAEVLPEIEKTRDALEQLWADSQSAFERQVYDVFKRDPGKARAMLTDYTNAQAGKAWRTWRALFDQLMKI